MKCRMLCSRLCAFLVVFALTLLLSVQGRAADFKVLYRFKGYTDGDTPGALILDAAGNLYGTTLSGGPSDYGTVFKLTHNPDGSWTKEVLHSFTEVADGTYPFGRLVFDTAGNLYGTTGAGGIHGFGTVFQLTANPDGSWTHAVLYRFQGGTDGASPLAGLIFDSAGNLYSTTAQGGGDSGLGTVFKMAKNPDGSWTESVLYRFPKRSRGFDPVAELVFDAVGNLYGTTLGGGSYLCPQHECGSVFKLTHNADGSWTHSVIHRFKGGDGSQPYGGVTFDAAGNLYGTTRSGGDQNRGVVFKLTPNPDGSWAFSKIHVFRGLDGALPVAGVIFDPAGNLDGTTSYGGVCNYGVVFRLTPSPDGKWTKVLLHRFHYTPDGAYPDAGLVSDNVGNLYGTTSRGGGGEVFEYLPDLSPRDGPEPPCRAPRKVASPTNPYDDADVTSTRSSFHFGF